MKQIVTVGKERWDNISQLAYGTPYEVNRIIAANPDTPITPVIPAGTVINIPIIEEYKAKMNTEKLPPWKR